MITKSSAVQIAALAQLESDCFGRRAWSADQIAQESAAGRIVEVATEGDEIIGYYSVSIVPPDSELMRLAVATRLRRAGWGARLLAEAIDTAVSLGATRMLLEVAADNLPALALYERFGFVEIANRRGYYSGIDAVVMERQLSNG